MSVNDNEVKIKISADGSEAIDGLDAVGGEVGNLGQKTRKSANDLKKYQKSWENLALGINQAWEILDKTGRLIGAGWDIAKQGAKLREAQSAFDNYAKSVGQNSNEIISKLKIASGGTIDNLGLITTASKAMSLGVTQNADKMANLLQIARNKARLFGMETSQAFEDIVTGIGRGSPLILDNLGIRIPAGFEKMTEGMTDAEKVAKLLDLTLEEGNKQLDEMGGMTDSAADKIRAFESSVTDLKSEFGNLLQEAFVPYVDFLQEDAIPLTRDFIKELRIAKEVLDVPSQILSTLYYDQDLKKYPESLEDAQQKYYEVNDRITQIARRMREAEPSMNTASWLYDAIKSKIPGAESYSGLRKELQALQKYSDELEALIVGLDKARYKANERAAFDFGIDDFIDALDEGANIIDEAVTDFDVLGGKVKTTSKALKEAREAYIDLLDATAAHYQMNRDVLPTIENFGGGLLSVVSAFEDMIDLTGVSGSELLKIPFLEVAEQAASLANSIDLIKEAMGSGFDKASMSMAKDAVSYMQKGMVGYFDFMTAGQQRSAWDAYGGNILSAIWGAGSETQDKKAKDSLSKTIAEAVSAGFANADFSNFSQTLGQMLSSILSKSISQQYPVMNAGGGVNWGNFGVNMATNFLVGKLTGSGGIFGKRQEKFKEETLQAASDLRSQMGNAWKESYEVGLLPYLTWTQKNDLIAGRYGYYGTQVGYGWNDSGGGWPFGDKTRTYNPIDQGASAALAKLTEAIKNAEQYNRSVEMGFELQTAKGYDYQVLVEQELAYRRAANLAYGGERTLTWTDGGKDVVDLTEAAHEIKIAAAEMARSLGQATGERNTATAQGFGQYAPWLDSIMGDLNVSQQYDAFANLQTNFMDRNISPFLVDIIEQTAQSQFELEKLRITDEDQFQTAYLDYLDRQAEAHKEIVERQRRIFEDEARTYEERAAAMQSLESALQNYHKIEIEKLQKKAAAEEEEKRLMAQQSRENIESSLSLMGEISQRNGNVLIIQSDNVSAALSELMTRFADDPEVTAILKKSKELADAQALWGKR